MSGYSELLITMGALALFGAFALHVHSMTSSGTTRSHLNEVQIEAVRIAESVVRRAVALPFDELTADEPLSGNNPSGLTHRNEFGMSTGQTQPADFDDFEGFSWDVEGVYGTYTVSCEVRYVTHNGNAFHTTPVRTLRKRLTVRVSHPAMNEPAEMNYIRSYH